MVERGAKVGGGRLPPLVQHEHAGQHAVRRPDGPREPGLLAHRERLFGGAPRFVDVVQKHVMAGHGERRPDDVERLLVGNRRLHHRPQHFERFRAARRVARDGPPRRLQLAGEAPTERQRQLHGCAELAERGVGIVVLGGDEPEHPVADHLRQRGSFRVLDRLDGHGASRDRVTPEKDRRRQDREGLGLQRGGLAPRVAHSQPERRHFAARPRRAVHRHEQPVGPVGGVVLVDAPLDGVGEVDEPVADPPEHIGGKGLQCLDGDRIGERQHRFRVALSHHQGLALLVELLEPERPDRIQEPILGRASRARRASVDQRAVDEPGQAIEGVELAAALAGHAVRERQVEGCGEDGERRKNAFWSSVSGS